jgi:hypothetical protein
VTSGLPFLSVWGLVALLSGGLHLCQATIVLVIE